MFPKCYSDLRTILLSALKDQLYSHGGSAAVSINCKICKYSSLDLYLYFLFQQNTSEGTPSTKINFIVNRFYLMKNRTVFTKVLC